MIHLFCLGQVKEDFDYFIDKSVHALYSNPDESILLIQNLMVNDKNPENLLVYQNILGQSYAMKGDFLNAIKSTIQNSSGNSDYVSGFYPFYMDYLLADQFQNLAFYGQSEKIISELLKKNNFPQHPQTKVTLGKINQLQAINFAVVKDYKNATTFLEKSDQYLTQNKTESRYLKIENQLFRGLILLNQNKLKDAKTVFEKVLTDKTLQESNFLFALAHENAARAYFLEQNYTKSSELLVEALNKIENKNYNQLRSKIYEDLSKVYLAQNNQTEFARYISLYNNSKDDLDKNKKSAINFLVSNIEKVNTEEKRIFQQNSEERTRMIVLSSIILLAISGIVLYIVQRRNKEILKQIDFFEKNLTPKSSQVEEGDFRKVAVTYSEAVVQKETKKTSLLSPEKEEELLQKLRDFENTKLFLGKQISLPFLAAELDTNIKYLSEVIKKYKDKNFNAYINDLRIQYIVNLLKTDSSYLNYKVSYLAEITGFSSHSAFTSIFKSITGMSPNDFIQQISASKKS